MSKIGVISLGCAKNQVDTEHMLGILREAGHTFVQREEEAEVLIVNTCGFIEPAKEESINTLLELAAYKQKNCRLLVATGCLSERYREELREALPEVDILLGVREYETLPALLKEKGEPCGAGEPASFCGRPRVLTTPPYRAYLRIGDGCNNKCAYCAIPLIRGPLVSEPEEALLREAQALAQSGVTELTVIAQDTSGYGKDLYGEPRLIPLLKKLNGVDGLRWVRLLYTYPDTVTPALIDTLAEGEKLVPYLDMPLQHISDPLLLAMHRRGSAKHIRSVMEYTALHAPEFTLRTTVMVGFPGETDAQFEELLAFLRQYPFDRVGAFAFSAEEGTEAALMPHQVPEEVKKERLAALMEQQRGISAQRNAARVGTETEVLVEGRCRVRGKSMLWGRSPAEAPDDADGRIYLPVSQGGPLPAGSYCGVKLVKAMDYDMMAERL